MKFRLLSSARLLAPLLVAACGADEGNDPTPQDPAPIVDGDDPSCERTMTQFAGDCRAPVGVDPTTDFVAHYGPSDYDDADEVAEYTVLPGEEPKDCAFPELSNEDPVYYNRYAVYSRPGMHHIILSGLAEGAVTGGRGDCGDRGSGSLLAVLQGGIEGSSYQYPPSGQLAPENAHIATKLTPHQGIAYELHAVNPTDYPLLRESWTVFHSMPADEVTDVAGQMAFNGGLRMSIPAHSEQTITNQCLVMESIGKVRVLDFFGHMHSHGQRFSAWAVHKDEAGAETKTLIYESYDWGELDLIEFNSTVQNDPVEYKGGKSGGVSGLLEFSPGDHIDYECAMDNTEDFALTFQARAFDGEMCNLFGSFTPGSFWPCLGY